jgi:hypothetical protein
MRINHHLIVSLIGIFAVATTLAPNFLPTVFGKVLQVSGLVSVAPFDEAVNIYRAYIPAKKAHFFTGSLDEYNKLVYAAANGYDGEGVAYRAFREPTVVGENCRATQIFV